ncbi:uncharacterized protein LOC141638266 [Silene latifolia]|uniref:uncharacterized protein LOC141638266 n=1 Tax=Silene latifolia TaxID=37657 RepID=UPI003D77A5CB
MSTSNSTRNSSKVVPNCWCGIPAAVKTSWTFQNPGRKFIACKFYNPETDMRGCRFFNWIDEDMTYWQRSVINDLLKEQKSLKNELKKQNKEVDDAKKLTFELEMLKKETKRNKFMLGLMFLVIFVLYGKMG